MSGARIFLYQTGLLAPGPGASDLLGSHVVTTNRNGEFTITGDYTCPSSSAQVYLVAKGGNPGLSPAVENQALLLMTALGDCGGVTASTFIDVNEASTAGAVWALSQFLQPEPALGANVAVNTSATNAAGLKNAFLTARELVDPATGAVPGSALPSGATTEPGKVYALANALASCVNSDGTSGCTSLFTAAAVAGVEPDNTLDAALNIVLHPAQQVSSVFQAGAAKAPFAAAASSPPNDWTLSVTYSGGGLNQPGSIAFDSRGDAWVANYFGGVVSEFLPDGTAAAPTGFAGAGLHQSFGAAVDLHDDVWISNENSVSGAGTHLGSVSKFSNAGAELSGYGYTGGGVYYPQGIAADPQGNIWVADYGDSAASLFGNDGSPKSGSQGFDRAGLPFTAAVAVDASGDAWFAVQQAAVKLTPSGGSTRYVCCNDPAGIALDPGGNVWLADYGGARVIELNASGMLQASVESPNGVAAAQGIAVDAAGNVFAADYRGDALMELHGADASVLSPENGFGLDAPLDEPLGIAVDASGNVWVSNAGGNTLTKFVGLASPVRTPMSGPPTAP